MKQYYKIGEISNLYGIGADSLRYYEEIGILKPKRDDNGYRMYSIRDILTLNILRELRSIGFSMKEIKEHLRDFNLEKTAALFEKEIDAIDRKMEELTALRAQLTARIEDIRTNLSNPPAAAPHLLKLPPRKILQLNENVYRDDDLDFVIKKLQKRHENQLYLIGNGDIGATLPFSELKKGLYGHFTSVFCIVEAANEEDFDDILPGGTYLSADVSGSYKNVPAAWSELFHEMDRQSFDADGEPMELYVIDNHDTGDESEYVTRLQIKIKVKA